MYLPGTVVAGCRTRSSMYLPISYCAAQLPIFVSLQLLPLPKRPHSFLFPHFALLAAQALTPNPLHYPFIYLLLGLLPNPPFISLSFLIPATVHVLTHNIPRCSLTGLICCCCCCPNAPPPLRKPPHLHSSHQFGRPH